MEKIVIPKIVKEQAKFLISMFGDNLVFLGQKNANDIYMFRFPENLRTGFPFVFSYNKENNSVDKITGFEALDIIGEFVKKRNKHNEYYSRF